MPSLSQWFWLLILLGVLSVPWQGAMVGSDGDACMHWRVGEHMLQTGRIIRSEVFSHTQPDKPIISKEWLSEIILAQAGRRAGLFGLCAVAAVLIATTFAMAHRQLVREGNDIMASTLLVLLACWASSIHWMARPHVFSFLLMFLWNDALRRFERDGRVRPVLIVLVVLTALWVNLHGAFLAGFLVLGAYGTGALVEWVAGLYGGDAAAATVGRRKLGQLMVVGLACAGASLLNPNGIALHLHNVHFLRSSFMTNWLAEYASLDFHEAHALGFLAWLAMMFLTLAVARPRLRVSEIVLVLSWTYFALYAGRNVPLLVIITAPILAPAISRAVRGRWRDRAQQLGAISAMCRGWPVVLGLAALWLARAPRVADMPAETWPVKAAAFVRDHPGQVQGNLFNQYLYGGFLMWYLPEHKVFVDGRADFYGELFIKEFDDTAALRPGWEQTFEKYRIGWTLMPAAHRVNAALALLPGWTVAYADETAVIYHRTP